MTTVVAELATYLMIYRKDEYKNLKKNIENVDAKIKKIDELFCS